MVRSRSGNLRAPDILTVSAEGLTEYWEVKFRSRPDSDESTGEPCYWVSDDALSDYLEVADRAPFWIVLYEAPNAHHAGRWLRASAHDIKASGRRERRYGRGGELLDAWVWPASSMTIVDGPVVGAPRSDEPLVLDEGEGEWVDNSEIVAASLRQWRAASGAHGTSALTSAPADRLIRADARLSLQAAALQLGLPAVPQYSVMRIGSLSSEQLAVLLTLIEHGVRVYLISDRDPTSEDVTPRLQAWRATRLLEVATVPGPPATSAWIVDGQVPPASVDVRDALTAADRSSSFNLGQYRIIHRVPDTNMAVLAGAGTGKTETMTERMVFLLATSISRGEVGSPNNEFLRATDFAFITFTKEAAAEMRARLNRTLLLRQRLCARPTQPFRQWASEMTATRISTIHSFAQGLIAEHGADAGYGNTLRVRSLLMPFRALIQRALSPHLAATYATWESAPAEYEWQKHVEAVWNGLENRAPMMSLYGPSPAPVSLGRAVGDEHNALAVTVTSNVLTEVASTFEKLCRTEGAVPLSQLVPLALAILEDKPNMSLPGLRHVFVDEFQDTDAQQIALVTELMRTTGCCAFLVGDVKQGIYRFRGAAGDAFTQVSQDFRASGSRLECHSLKKNFRSTPALLGKMDTFFQAWRDAGVLDYDGTLTAMRPRTADQRSIVLQQSGKSEEVQAAAAAAQVEAWRRDDPDASIGILCRENRQAGLIKEALARRQIDCVTYTGGQFFRTPAVREFRALLEAITDPSNDSAVLELMQTRWGGGMASAEAAPELQLTESESLEWKSAAASLTDWPTRMREFSAGRFDLSDLAPLRRRVQLISALTRRTSPLNVITSLMAAFQPRGVALERATPSDQQTYHRCLSHLVTILVEQFEGGSATLTSMLEWLRIKIATDSAEDEPVDPELVQGDRVCVALTVHKAKGLQYRRVIIPFTRGKFLRATGRGRTSASVVDHDGRAKLLWQWNPVSGPSMLNHDPSDPEAAVDQQETVKEETRLLYVAMTRAQDELVILTGQRSAANEIKTWTDLLKMGAGQ